MRTSHRNPANRLKSLIAAAALIAAASAPAEAKTSSASTFTLDNGLQVVVLPDHRVPIVYHSVWYRIGAVDDAPADSGRAHFLEHMMFKATRTYQSGYLDRAIARAGGMHNGTTSYDDTYYHQVVPKEKLSEMMAIEADRMTNIQFTDEELERERGAILQERKMRIDRWPGSRLDERMRATVYAGSIYERMPAGTENTIRAVTTARAYELYKEAYAPNNAVLLVAGDVTEDEVRSLATTHYGPVKPMACAPVRPSDVTLAPIPAPRLTEIDPQASTPTIARYYRAPATSHADTYPLIVLHNHLNIATGRLRSELVDKLRLATSAGTALESLRLTGMLGVSATAAPGVGAEALEAALDTVLDDVRRNGVPAAEVSRIVKAIGPSNMFGLDDIIVRATYYGRQVTAGRSIEWIETEVERQQNVTVEDVKRVAALYLDPANAVTGTLLPATAAAPISANH